MPSITIAAGATEIVGNSDPGPGVASARKSLVICLEGAGDCRWGWRNVSGDGSTISATNGPTKGMPLTAGVPIAFDAETLRMNATLKVFSTAGCELTYEENRHP